MYSQPVWEMYKTSVHHYSIRKLSRPGKVEVQQKNSREEGFIIRRIFFLKLLIDVIANVLYNLDWIQKRVLKLEHIIMGHRQKYYFKTFGNMVETLHITPTHKHEERYKRF